jgi:transcription-repair coupling factor (superfamily II helicase)
MNDLLHNDARHLVVGGLSGSAKAMAFSALFAEQERSWLIIMDDADAAAYLYHDLSHLLSAQQLAIFPSLYRNIHRHGVKDRANEILRIDALNRLQDGQPCIVVTSPEGLPEKAPSAAAFNARKLPLATGQHIEWQFLCRQLEEFGFEQVDFVYEPGQFSQRGSIVDVFSFANELPYRIDFFGDTVETIRTFNIENQLSLSQEQQMTVIADFQTNDDSKATIFDFLPKESIVAMDNSRFVIDRINQLRNDASASPQTSDERTELLDRLQAFRTVECGKSLFNDAENITFNTVPQPLFHKNFEIVAEIFKRYLADGYRLYIAADSKKQTDRISAILTDRGEDIPFTPVLQTIHEGFIDHDLKCGCFTDHQIFERFHKFSLRSDITRSGKIARILKELNQFAVGDYIVHIDHGIGRFGGLQKIDTNGRRQEVIKLLFRDNDVIFVNIHALHRITKYKGKDGDAPTLSKLGSGAWERLKERTKSKVKDIARDLIRLYAQRKNDVGFAFSPDCSLQQELEASFIYEDTPDQEKATRAVKEDMERARPMDRLVCGDVGFGKTEVAIRAAFKAVIDRKQVAVLVPTTILALQHYNTFTERLKDYPCNIEYLTRAKTAKQTREIEKRLANGEIHIIIGTQKLLWKNVLFNDLGLLIIDEEQKFGVAIKEKLKQMHVNVDTLTLTATPIPRTLQFSLMGARDLSIINTPPPNRHPILTEIISFDEDIIRDIITAEINRNGQVFFVNTRIRNNYDLAEKLKQIVPEARIAIAHGKLSPQQLEEVVIDFVNYEADILLSTTVIESGIDMPNVNTIIISNANHFGLSDLHQLRGRVGRSNKKAYCYLIAPPINELTGDARRRLSAIETFTDLGSGFNIAMHDLDIRGAGNLLGAEQSGFIADLGYDTYQRILNEAMTELREEEFKDVFTDEQTSNADSTSECMFETDINAMFPESYVASIPERMMLYRELDAITDESSLQAYEARLIDRFGALPAEATDLIQVVRLRRMAAELGIERLILKQDMMVASFVPDTESSYFRSAAFDAVLTYMTKHGDFCRLSPNKARPSVTFSPLKTINGALRVLSSISAIRQQQT